MQQFTQKHSNTIAVAAISGSVLILLFVIAGAMVFRKAPEAVQPPKVEATPTPIATPSPSVTPSPSPTETPQTTAPLQAPQNTAESPAEESQESDVEAIATATVQIEGAQLKGEPSAKSEAIGQMHKSQPVTILQGTVLEGSARWYLVKAGNMQGYVLATSLSRPVMAQPSQQQAPVQQQEIRGAEFKAQYL